VFFHPSKECTASPRFLRPLSLLRQAFGLLHRALERGGFAELGGLLRRAVGRRPGRQSRQRQGGQAEEEIQRRRWRSRPGPGGPERARRVLAIDLLEQAGAEEQRRKCSGRAATGATQARAE